MRSPRFVMPAASPATIIIGRCRRTSSSSSETSDFALSLRLQEASSDRPGGYVRRDVLEFGADLAPTWWGEAPERPHASSETISRYNLTGRFWSINAPTCPTWPSVRNPELTICWRRRSRDPALDHGSARHLA